MSEKILVSGFDHYSVDASSNVSCEVALPAIGEQFGDIVESVVLPPAHDEAARQLLGTIQEVSPVAVVMFGVASGRAVRLECRAQNLTQNIFWPDVNGIRRFGRVDPFGRAIRLSTLPVDAISLRLRDRGIPRVFSTNAGGRITNEVMYQVLSSASEGSNIFAGAIQFGEEMPDEYVQEASLLVIDEVSKSAHVN